MKKVIGLLSLMFFLAMNLFSQKIAEFPKAWETKLTFKPEVKIYHPEGICVFVATDKEMAMLDGNDGKIKWQVKYQDALKVKKFEFINWSPDAGVIILSNEDDKKKNSEKLFIDDQTGALLWKSDRLIQEFEHYKLTDMISNGYIQEIKAIPVYTKEAVQMIEVRTGKVLWQNPNYTPKQTAVKSSFGMSNEEKETEKELYSFRIEIDATSKNLSIHHDRIVNYVDYQTGAELDYLSFYNVDFIKKQKPKMTMYGGKQSFIDEDNDMFLTLSYDFLSWFAAGTKKKCKLSAFSMSQKNKLWETEFEAEISRKMVTNEDMVDVFIRDRSLFFLSEGLVCIDIKTGKEMWNIPFFRTEYNRTWGLPIGGVKVSKEQTPFASAAPVITDDAVYIVNNDNKVDRLIRYDRKTGQKFWETDKFKFGDYIPELFIKGDRAIVGFGGLAYVEKSTSNLSTQERTLELLIKYKGKNGVRGYDINTGKEVWNTEKMKDQIKDKFSGAITNLLYDDNNLYVASDLNLFAFDIQTGAVQFSKSIKELKLGKPFELIFSKDSSRIYIHFEKGIAAYNKNDGGKVYAVNTGKFISDFYEGENYFIWVGKEYLKEEELIGFDLNMGIIKGKYKFKTEFSFWETFKSGHITRVHKKEWFTRDGNYLFSFDGDQVIKYRINK